MYETILSFYFVAFKVNTVFEHRQVRIYFYCLNILKLIFSKAN